LIFNIEQMLTSVNPGDLYLSLRLTGNLPTFEGA